MSASPAPAPLWRRLAAGLYDLFPLLALWFVTDALALWLSAGALAQPHPPLAARLPLQAALLGVSAAYFVLSWRRGGQTLGARAWRVRVVGADGQRPGWRAALLRFGVGWLSLLCLGLGFAWAAFDAEGRSWHDRASGTRLVRST